MRREAGLCFADWERRGADVPGSGRGGDVGLGISPDAAGKEPRSVFGGWPIRGSTHRCRPNPDPHGTPGAQDAVQQHQAPSADGFRTTTRTTGCCAGRPRRMSGQR